MAITPSNATNTHAALTFKQQFDAGVQDELRDKTVFMDIADVETSPAEFIYKRYGEDVPADSTSNDRYEGREFEYFKESVGLDHTAYKAEYISWDETVKQGFEIKADRIDRHAEALARKINRETAQATYAGAGQTLVDGDLVTATNSGGSNPIILSSSSVDDVLASIEMKLNEQNAQDSGMPYLMMRPKDARSLGLYNANSGNVVGDDTIRRGFRRFAGSFGFDIMVTNDIPLTVTGTASTNFTNGGTVSVGGVTFTFATTPAAAGEVDLGADLATSLSNLAAAINNSNGYDAGAGSASAYFEVTAANRDTLKNYNVAATATATTITVTANGGTTIAVAETEATGDFAWGTVRSVMLAGARGSTTLRLPEGGYHSKVLDQIDGFFGIQLRTAQKFDHKVWVKTAPKIVSIPLVA